MNKKINNLYKVLLIGGSSYLGREFIFKFHKDYKITASYFNNKISFDEPEILSKIRLCKMDINDKNSFEKIISEYFDYIVILIGQQNKNTQLQKKLNIGIIKNLIFFLKKYNFFSSTKIIYASSALVYPGGQKSFKESDKIYPNSEYSKQKLDAERLIIKSKINYIILRFANIFGKNQNKGLISFIMKTVKDDEKFFLEDENKERSFVHVSDAASGISNAINSNCNNEIYNLSSTNEKLIKVLEIFERLSGKKIKKHYRKFGDPKKIIISNEKVIRDLGYKPSSTFTDGIKDMYLNY